MNRKISITIALFLAMMGSSLAQNQYRITQYMLQHSFINPAAIGNDQRLNAAIFYRNQWTGIEGAPVTQGLTVNVPFKNEKHNVGFYAYNDRIGINKNMSFSGTYAFNAKLTAKTKLAFGLSVSLDLKQSNFSEVNPENPLDPVFMGDSRMFAMPNFKFGTYYFSEKFYAGFAIPNLLENKIVYDNSIKGNTSFNVKDFHYYLHGGYSFELNENIDLNVSALLKEVSGAPLQVDINPQVMIQDKFGIGATYRTSQEIAALINFRITSMFRLGYAYDYSFSPLGNYSNGSHEVMIIYSMSNAKQPIIHEAPRF